MLMEKALKTPTVFFMCAVLACSCGPGPDDEEDDDKTGTDQDSGAGDTDTDTDADDDIDDEPIEDLTTLETNSFILDIKEEDWTEPVGVGGEIGGYVPLFAFEIRGVDGTDLDVLMGTADGNEQDKCNKTESFEGVVDPNPDFIIGPGEFEAIITGEESKVIATVHDLTISGTFTGQGTGFAENVLTATVDFRDIAELFTLLTDPTADKICETAPNMGFECEECPFDGQTYCISLKAQNFKATQIEGLSIDETDEFGDGCLD